MTILPGLCFAHRPFLAVRTRRIEFCLEGGVSLTAATHVALLSSFSWCKLMTGLDYFHVQAQNYLSVTCIKKHVLMFAYRAKGWWESERESLAHSNTIQ